SHALESRRLRAVTDRSEDTQRTARQAGADPDRLLDCGPARLRLCRLQAGSLWTRSADAGGAGPAIYRRRLAATIGALNGDPPRNDELCALVGAACPLTAKRPHRRVQRAGLTVNPAQPDSRPHYLDCFGAMRLAMTEK